MAVRNNNIMEDNSKNVTYWLGCLSSRLAQFEATPNITTKTALLIVMGEYQNVVTNGLDIPRTVPEPLKRARTYTEWFQRQLAEAMAMFRINPSDERMKVMAQHLSGYQDAVAMGRVKL